MTNSVLNDIFLLEKAVVDCLTKWDNIGALQCSDMSKSIFVTTPYLCDSQIDLYALHLQNRFAVFWNDCKFDECRKIIKQLDKLPLIGASLIKKLHDEAELEYMLANYPKALMIIERAIQYPCTLNERFELLLLKGKVEHEIIGIPFKINTFSEALGLAEALGNQGLIAAVYSELYTMFYSRYPGLGVYFARKAEVIYADKKDYHNLIRVQLYIALTLQSIYDRIGNPNGECFKSEADKIVNSINEQILVMPSEIAFYNRVKGLVLKDETAIEKALDYYLNVSKNKQELDRTLQMMLDVFIYTQNYEKLMKYMPLCRKSFAPQLKKELDDIEYCLSHKIPAKRFQEFDCRKPEEPYTLLDVLDRIALDEEQWFEDRSVMRSLFPTYTQEGKFETMGMPDGKTILMPCSLSFNNYYRGEREFHQECKPSLYRRSMTPAKQFVERLKYEELCLLMEDYPLVQYYRNGIGVKFPDGSTNIYELYIDKLALAQHYGICTELMDFTVDKFVAAFFACTKCDSSGKYSINDEDGDGCFYRYVDNNLLYGKRGKLRAVGLQPFSRPGEQAGYVLPMSETDDLNNLVLEAIHFKHNRKVSEFIFNYTNRSNKLFPKSILDDKAIIIKNSDKFSYKAYEMAKAEFYPDGSDDLLMGYIEEEHKSLCESPIVTFTSQEIKDFHNDWERGGEEGFISKILIRHVWKGPIKIVDKLS